MPPPGAFTLHGYNSKWLPGKQITTGFLGVRRENTKIVLWRRMEREFDASSSSGPVSPDQSTCLLNGAFVDLHTGRVRAQLGLGAQYAADGSVIHFEGVQGLASPNGRLISRDGGGLEICDPQGKSVASLDWQGQTTYPAWSPDGTRFAAARFEHTCVWDTASWRPVSQLDVGGPLAFVDRGHLLIPG